MYPPNQIHFMHCPSRQQGVALVIALVLLLVVTIIGLAGIQGTNLQERMTANMYDRSLAFQRAEAGLRAAEVAITANWKISDLGGVDCSGATPCTMIPTNTFTNTDSTWIDVPTLYDVNDSRSPGSPQYHIDFTGTGPAENDLGLQANADYANYGSPYPPDSAAYYRVTVRSSNPTQATDRAIVVLQTTVKRAY